MYYFSSMKTPKLILSLGLILALASCQKEISGDAPEQPGGGGNTNGNLLVKGIQITPATSDTNVVTAEWDASSRLKVYKTNVVVNGFPTLFTSTITRAGDGRITKIFSKTDLIGTFVDSVIYNPTYVGNTTQLKYVYSVQYSSFLGEISDSSVYTYNAAGYVSSKESFQNFWGTMEPAAKETYEYDGNGNVTKISMFQHDGTSYSLASVQTITYSSHKSPVTLGEECVIILGVINSAKNNIAQIVINNVAAGQTNTVVASNMEYNSFDRPIKGTLTVNPIPPGYVNNVTYFYQ